MRKRLSPLLRRPGDNRHRVTLSAALSHLRFPLERSRGRRYPELAHPYRNAFQRDRDPVALEAARSRLALFGDRVTLIRSPFSALASLLDDHPGAAPLSGVLLDLGVSSPQLDEAARGFSFRLDAPPDMRMNQSSGVSAADLVKSMQRKG